MAIEDFAGKAASAAGKKAASKSASKATEAGASKVAKKAGGAAAKGASAVGKAADATTKPAEDVGGKFGLGKIGGSGATEKKIKDLAAGASEGKKEEEAQGKTEEAKATDPFGDGQSRSATALKDAKTLTATPFGPAQVAGQKAAKAGRAAKNAVDSAGGVKGSEYDKSDVDDPTVAAAKQNVKETAKEAKDVGKETLKGVAAGAAKGATAAGAGAVPGAVIGGLKGLGKGILKSKKIKKIVIALAALSFVFSPVGLTLIQGAVITTVLIGDEAAQEGASNESAEESGVEADVASVAEEAGNEANVPREVISAMNHIQNGGTFQSGTGSGGGGGDDDGDGGGFSGEYNEGFDTTTCDRLGTNVEEGLTENAVKAYRAVCNAFPEVKSVGGRRYSSYVGNQSQHYTGEAVDFMINDSGTNDSALGTKIEEFLLEHGSEINLYYTIWEQEITYGDGRSNMMNDRGDETQNHFDHVHLSVCDGKSNCKVTADGSGGDDGGDNDEGGDSGESSGDDDQAGEEIKGTEASGVGPFKIDMDKVEELADEAREAQEEDDDAPDYPILTEDEAEDLNASGRYLAKILHGELPDEYRGRGLDYGSTHEGIEDGANVRGVYRSETDGDTTGTARLVNDTEDAYVEAIKKLPIGNAEENASPIFRLARLWSWGVPPSEADCSALPASKNGSWTNPFVGDQTGADFGDELDDDTPQVDGESDTHLGEDYILTDDGVIKAAAKGEVVRATESSVVISHGSQVQSVTELMDEVEVEEGDELDVGDTIGTGGDGDPGGGGDPKDNDSDDSGGGGSDDGESGGDDEEGSGGSDDGSDGENDPTRNTKDGKTAFVDNPTVEVSSKESLHVGGEGFSPGDDVEVTTSFDGRPETPEVDEDGTFEVGYSGARFNKGANTVTVVVNGDEHSEFTVTGRDPMAANAADADADEDDHGVIHYQINEGSDAVNPSSFLRQRGVELGAGDQPGNGRDGDDSDDSGGSGGDGDDSDGGDDGPNKDPSKEKSADGMTVTIGDLTGYAGDTLKLSGSGFDTGGSPNVNSDFAAGLQKIDVGSDGSWNLEYPLQQADVDNGTTTLTVKGYSAETEGKQHSFDFSVRALDRNEDDSQAMTKDVGDGSVTLKQPIITAGSTWQLEGEGLPPGKNVYVTVGDLDGDWLIDGDNGRREIKGSVDDDGTWEAEYKPRRGDTGSDSGWLRVAVDARDEYSAEFAPIGVTTKAASAEAQAGAEGVERTATENSVSPSSSSSSTGDQQADDTNFDSLGDSLKAKKANGDEITIKKEGLKNAATVIGVGSQLDVGEEGVKSAILTTLIETGGTIEHAVSASGTFVGIFQQYDAWGTEEERSDPEHAARAYFGGPDGPNGGDPRGGLDYDGWEDLNDAIDMGAQVQGIDPAGGSKGDPNWRPAAADWLPVAEAIMGQVDGTVLPDNCEDDSQGWNGERADGYEWGGHDNARIPRDELCSVTVGTGKVGTTNSQGEPADLLRCDAARQYDEMATAYEEALGHPAVLNSAYRDWDEQAAQDPSLGAPPGQSVHGWGLSVDVGVGGQFAFKDPRHVWIAEHGMEYGFEWPEWAQPGSRRPEAWHFDYIGKYDGSTNDG
jgi:hypothetical protein